MLFETLSTLISLSTVPLEPRLAPPVPHCAACSFTTAGAFVHTLNARPMPQGLWSVGLRLDWIEYDAFSDPQLTSFAMQGDHVHSMDRTLMARASVLYGLTDHIGLGLDLPYVSMQEMREGEDMGGGMFDVMEMGDSAGLGDASLFASFAVHADDDAGRYVSLIVGAELPTGEDDAKDDDGARFEPDHQPGSGSVDPFVGVAASTALAGGSAGLSALYTIAGDGSQDSTLGDILRISAAFARPFSEDPQGLDWRWMLEAGVQWQDRMEMDDMEDDDTGGVQWFTSPGLRCTSQSGWSWFASLGVPIAQNLHGHQVEAEWRLSTGLGWSF